MKSSGSSGRPARSDIILEYGEDYRGQLFKAFVEPFVDVAESAGLFGQDVLNSLKLAFDTLNPFNLSPASLRKARDEYKERRGKIARDWEPLMKKAGESLQSPDVALAAMVLAPNLFFGAQALKMGGRAPRTVADYLEGAGWKVPILSAFTSQAGSKGGKSLEDKFEEWLDKQEKAEARANVERSRSGIAGKLRVFFFGEAAWHPGDLIREAEGDEGPGMSRSELAFALDDLVRDVIAPAVAPSAEELLTAKREQAESLVSAANAVIGGLRDLAQADSPEGFEAALQKMEGNVTAVGGGEAVDLGPVRDAVQGLKTAMDKKYEEVKGGQGPAPEGSKPEDIEAVAKRASEQAFKQAAGELRKMASESAESIAKNYREVIAKELTSDIPLKGPVAAAIAGTEAGAEVLEFIKGAVDSVGK
jgi:hypothetical protein